MVAGNEENGGRLQMEMVDDVQRRRWTMAAADDEEDGGSGRCEITKATYKFRVI